jgi:citrate lyase subunit beta/citryl-CoA lyase
MSFRPRRSALFLPASNPRAIEKARGLAADVVIVDLEDAVAPDVKAAARETAITAADQGFGTREVVIRVNGLDTEWGAADLAAVRGTTATVLVPKIRNAGDVKTCRDPLGSEAPLWVMIETCEALGRGSCSA